MVETGRDRAAGRKRLQAAAFAAALGYGAAVCAVAAVMLLVVGVGHDDLTVLRLYPVAVLVALVFALPAAMLARAALYMASADGLGAYVAAGATAAVATGAAAVLLSDGPAGPEGTLMAVALALSGAAGGATYRMVEKLVLNASEQPA